MRSDHGTPAYIRARVANACDSCKQRKVKCDGKLPCSYCTRRQRASECRFSRNRRRLTQHRLSSHSSPVSGPVNASPRNADAFSHASDVSAEEEAEVPREARLISDGQGQSIFIGDCAPLSLFQTIRHIVTTRVDSHAFTPETSRFSVLENAGFDEVDGISEEKPTIDVSQIESLVSKFFCVTVGVVDLFDSARLADEITAWHEQPEQKPGIKTAVYHLVLAIGLQSRDEDLAASHFRYAKRLAMFSLGGNLGLRTVQAFILITLYMHRACQINGAFLFFGIAVRAAYSIGVHRTEVNSRFGPETHSQRDRLWRSLRTLDLLLSVSMGRPPATSDADCTVAYEVVVPSDEQQQLTSPPSSWSHQQILTASAQILLVAEGIVLQVYSRRKVSLQLAGGLSAQLREWSARWRARLQGLLGVVSSSSSSPSSSPAADDDDDDDETQAAAAAAQQVAAPGHDLVTAACRALATYYYAVMLVSRPFLMYELCRKLPPPMAGEKNHPHHHRYQDPNDGNGNGSASSSSSGRSKLANACIDAATLMIEAVLGLVERGVLDGRLPFLVSWLFAASLVVSVGLLGGFGRVLEKPARQSLRALAHFAARDAHARQYALIAEALLATATAYLDRREAGERRRIAADSGRLFGLTDVPDDGDEEEEEEEEEEDNKDNDKAAPAAAAAAAARMEGGSGGGGGGGSGGGGSSPDKTAIPTAAAPHAAGILPDPPNHHQHHHQHPNTNNNNPFWLFDDTPGTSTDHPSSSMLSSLMEPMFGADDHSPLAEGGGGGGAASDVFGAMNLFPLLDGNGHIDLAHPLAGF
ncbi:fungal-specific transcription factor domain-containing protein [Xylariomycetidae sp. FL0641]|nr:fungal-specific transcription factor domain-containing protein [Xylariomycetidae sp. FL0641]